MSMTIQQIESAVNEANMTLKACGRHWQVIGGIAIVNLYPSKGRWTIHVQGTGAGRRLKSVEDLIESATAFKPGKKIERKRCNGARNRKWRKAIRDGKQPRWRSDDRAPYGSRFHRQHTAKRAPCDP